MDDWDDLYAGLFEHVTDTHAHGYYDRDGKAIGHDDWVRLFADLEYRTVARTQIANGIEVSTVWIGIDHRPPPPLTPPGPPLIYETMIFGLDLDRDQWRYPNRDAALAGHDQAVAIACNHLAHTSRAQALHRLVTEPRKDADETVMPEGNYSEFFSDPPVDERARRSEHRRLIDERPA